MAGPVKRRIRFHHFLLLVPFAALWTPFFDRAEPALDGIPFFYWAQMACIVLAMALLYVVWCFDHGSK